MAKPRSSSVRRRPAARKSAQPRSKSAAPGLLDAAPVVAFSYRHSGAGNHRFTAVSAQAKNVLGVAAAALLKKPGALRLHPDDVATFETQVLGAMAKGEGVDAHVRVMPKANQSRWVQISAWLQSRKNREAHYTGIILDIDARKRAEADMARALERMEEAQDIAKMGWYDLNVQDRVIDLTSEFADHLGMPFAPGGRVTGADFDKYREAFLNAIHPEDRERYMSIINDRSWWRTEFDYRILTRTNEVRHLCSKIKRTADKSGNRTRDFAVVLDITERKRLEEDLRAQAATDPLTGVPNRRSFETTARREVERARRYAKPFAVLALDIDHFKKVNDTYGHDIGDIVLKGMARICLDKLRVTDVLARLGGEEFAMLLPETDIEAAATLADRLRAAIATTPITTAKGPLPVTVSLGVAQYAPNEPTIDAALKRADEALYEAKHSGRNKVVVAKLPSLVRSTA
jgi:diguanylate cyclase (GGDEF)-like protein/PAS domain S-box-containing protein